MSTVIAPDLGAVIRIDGKCYEKMDPVDGPPTHQDAQGYATCPECEGDSGTKKCLTLHTIGWDCDSNTWHPSLDGTSTLCVEQSVIDGLTLGAWILEDANKPCDFIYYQVDADCESDNDCSPLSEPTRPTGPPAGCCPGGSSGGSDGSGSGSSPAEYDEWNRCDGETMEPANPFSITLPKDSFPTGKLIKHTASTICYEFIDSLPGDAEDDEADYEGELSNAPNPENGLPTALLGGPIYAKNTDCEWCDFDNVEYVEILTGTPEGSCHQSLILTKQEFVNNGESPVLSYDGRCFRLKGGTNDGNNLGGAVGQHGGQCACVEALKNYNVKWGECANNPDGRPDFVIKQWVYNPLGNTLEQNFGCYAEPTDKCASITCKATTPITQGPITYNECKKCTGADEPSNEGPPEGGGGGGGGPGGGSGVGGSGLSTGGSTGSDAGAGSVTPEICDTVCPEATLEMVSGAFIGSTSVFSSSFDLTSISENASITKNSGFIATNHAVISSMTVTKKADGYIDIIVDYAFAPADNRLSGGQVSYTDVATNVLNINNTKAGISGDVGDVEVTLEGTPCCATSSGSSSGASSGSV